MPKSKMQGLGSTIALCLASHTMAGMIGQEVNMTYSFTGWPGSSGYTVGPDLYTVTNDVEFSTTDYLYNYNNGYGDPEVIGTVRYDIDISDTAIEFSATILDGLLTDYYHFLPADFHGFILEDANGTIGSFDNAILSTSAPASHMSEWDLWSEDPWFESWLDDRFVAVDDPSRAFIQDMDTAVLDMQGIGWVFDTAEEGDVFSVRWDIGFSGALPGPGTMPLLGLALFGITRRRRCGES